MVVMVVIHVRTEWRRRKRECGWWDKEEECIVEGGWNELGGFGLVWVREWMKKWVSLVMAMW